MAYFLKKAKQGKRTYLAIYESFYSNDIKGTKHHCFKSLGSIDTLIDSGISDPIAHFQKEVDALNEERKKNDITLIDQSPLRYLGYFPLKLIMDKLDVKKLFDLYKLTTNFKFDLYDVLSSLIYSRAVKPCSKYKTFHDVLPYLFANYDFSYDQMIDGLSFLGNDYEKIIELFTSRYKQFYNFDASVTYFDCTNFFFEIDREDDFRKKGPSKENKKDPIVGLGLLLDANQIPIGMKMYPGNESEKPVMREVIDELKKQNEIAGRTIHVADKGLNCAENIAYSKGNGDGYLFSKSVKTLPETEKTWVLLENDYIDVKDKNGKLVYRYKSCVDKFPYSVVRNGKKVTVMLKEKRLVTFNPSLANKKKSEICTMIEKAKKLTLSKAKKSEFGECAKYVEFKSVESTGEINDEKVFTQLNEKMMKKDLELAGYNMLVTSEIKMKDEEIYHTYHNLWRIEESFRIMKSDLDARPVFAQKKESIQGHFLVCYLTVFLERIWQFNILGNEYCSNDIFNFFKEYKVVRAEGKYINTTSSNDFIKSITKKFNLPLMNYFLTEKQIKKVLDYKI